MPRQVSSARASAGSRRHGVAGVGGAMAPLYERAERRRRRWEPWGPEPSWAPVAIGRPATKAIGRPATRAIGRPATRAHHGRRTPGRDGRRSGRVRRRGRETPASAPRSVHPGLPGPGVLDPLGEYGRVRPGHRETPHGPRRPVRVVEVHPQGGGLQGLRDAARRRIQLEGRDVPVSAGRDAVPPWSFCHATRLRRRSDRMGSEPYTSFRHRSGTPEWSEAAPANRGLRLVTMRATSPLSPKDPHQGPAIRTSPSADR